MKEENKETSSKINCLELKTHRVFIKSPMKGENPRVILTNAKIASRYSACKAMKCDYEIKNEKSGIIIEHVDYRDIQRIDEIPDGENTNTEKESYIIMIPKAPGDTLSHHIEIQEYEVELIKQKVEFKIGGFFQFRNGIAIGLDDLSKSKILPREIYNKSHYS